MCRKQNDLGHFAEQVFLLYIFGFCIRLFTSYTTTNCLKVWRRLEFSWNLFITFNGFSDFKFFFDFLAPQFAKEKFLFIKTNYDILINLSDNSGRYVDLIMNSQKLIKQEIIDHNLQVKAIIQVSWNQIFTKNISRN